MAFPFERSQFTATDPLGRKVRCSRDNWVNHIVDKHPELVGQELEVKAAIEHPSYVIPAERKGFQEYYAKRPSAHRKKGRYTKVVVQLTGKKTGRVVTAYRARDVRHVAIGEYLWLSLD